MHARLRRHLHDQLPHLRRRRPATDPLGDRTRSTRSSRPTRAPPRRPPGRRRRSSLAADRHRRGVRRRPRRVARRRRRRSRPARPRVGRPPRARRRSRRASSTRPATPRRGARRPSRSTTPSRRTRPRVRDRAVAQLELHDDGHRHRRARPACSAVEYKLDGGATRRRHVTITAEGSHTLDDPRRRRRRQRLRLAHRHDRHRQDRADAGRRLRRHGLAQHAGRLLGRRRPAGSPAWRADDARGGDGAVVDGGATPCDADGATTVTSAPSTAPATRRPPRPTSRSTARRRRAVVNCIAGRQALDLHLHGERYGRRCPACRPDLVGRRLGPRPRSPTAARSRRQGHGRRHRDRLAGNGAASAPVALADRTAPATPTPTPRTATEAVLLRKGGGTPPRAWSASSRSPRPPTVDDRRPAAARARQGHVPVRLQGHAAARSPRRSPRPRRQEGLLDADQRQAAARRPRRGHADGQAQVRQALGHARHRLRAT